MGQLFGSKPKADPSVQKAQRRQSQAVEKQTADEAREAGARRRSLQAARQGGGLFSKTGAAGVKKTLGG